MEDSRLNSHEKSLFELNQEEVSRLIPLLIYMSFIGLFGIPGNSLVIYAFKNSCRRSNSRLFFVWLAIIDLFNCSLILPLEFVNVVNQYTYDDAWLCKMTIFLTIWPSVTSGLMLAVISVERFRKVCRPLKWQFSNKVARLLCLVTLITGLLSSWPALIIFGLYEYELTTQNITGTECAITNEYETTVYMKIYNGILWILFMTTISIIIAMYIIIGRQMFKQTANINRLTLRESTRYRVQSRDKPSPDSASETISSNSGFAAANSTFSERDDDSCSVSLASDKRVSTPCNTKSDGKASKRQARTRKSAMIMFFISLVFILSYLPYLILRLLEGVTVHFVSSMTDSERTFYKSLLRSYWINCAANPIIYCACAPQFRRELKGLWLKLRRRN